jgi:hypothetical protein
VAPAARQAYRAAESLLNNLTERRFRSDWEQIQTNKQKAFSFHLGEE